MYKTDGVEFESKEIADAWYECLNEIVCNLKEEKRGLYQCPHCNDSPVNMPGYLYFHFKQDENAFKWLLNRAKTRL